MPNFRYFLYQSETPLDEKSSDWDAFLPTDRNASCDNSVSYGQYFLAVRAFLEQQFPNAQDSCIRIMKHGEFYHPAKINVLIDGKNSCFAANVAVSEIGQYCIQREFDLLKQLYPMTLPPSIPRVFAIGTGIIRDNLEIPMFLAEWFEDYHEFHLSRTSEGRYAIQVWDTENGYYFLSEDQSFSLYCQTAKILTSYYNPETFEQIFPWHHAAGDFVIRRNRDDTISVKLITVRQYISPMETEEKNPEVLAEALLAFIIHLSIRMRLDRADGVGEIVWADDAVVSATVNGFWDALAVRNEFRAYLSSWTETELSEMADAIIASYHPLSPETEVIRRHLNCHIAELYKALISSQS